MPIEREVGTAADRAYEETVRIPAGVMRLLRKSYDTREKVLDWIMAIGVAIVMILVFREHIWALFYPGANGGVNTGRVTTSVPNQEVDDAVGPSLGRPGEPTRKIYTYNMPISRSFKYRVGPSGTRVPWDPSVGGSFPSVDPGVPKFNE